MKYVTNNGSAVTVGLKTTWTDCEGAHIGTVSEIWGDQNIAVADGNEHGMEFTAFVPLTVLAEELECWRCGAEGGQFTPPAHPDGGGTICHECYEHLIGPTQRPEAETWDNLTAQEIANLVNERR